MESVKKAFKILPNNILDLCNLAAAYILLGPMEEASEVAKKILKLDPKFSLNQFAKSIESRYKNKADSQFYIDSLRKAGLPD